MTRAADRLYIYAPLRYYHRRFAHSDAHGYAQLTRFLPPESLTFFRACLRLVPTVPPRLRTLRVTCKAKQQRR